MKMPKLRMIIINEETGQELFNEVSDDLTYNMTNDLMKIPTFAGDYEAPPMYSRGWSVTVDAYFVNPNIDKDYKDCMEEIAARAEARRG